MFANVAGSRHWRPQGKRLLRDVRCRLLAECSDENGALVCSVVLRRGTKLGGTLFLWRAPLRRGSLVHRKAVSGGLLATAEDSALAAMEWLIAEMMLDLDDLW